MGLVAVLFCATIILSLDGYCDEPTEEDTYFEFTFSDATTKNIKITDTDIATSTVVTPEGMSHDSCVFNLSLDRMPTSVTIHANKGEFRVSITITTTDPAMEGHAMRINFGEYTEDLTPSGGYSCTIPSSTSEWLEPNHRYATSLYIDDGTGTYVPYDPPSGLKVSMKWESSEKTRFVRFLCDGDAVGSRFYNTGDTIGDFPHVTGKSVPIKGWFDSNGDEVHSDTVYNYQGDMDFHAEYMIDLTTLGIIILLVIIMGMCGMLITERMD